jgi:hypothetical protein
MLRPYACAEGEVLVVVLEEYRVQVFLPDGELLHAWEV